MLEKSKKAFLNEKKTNKENSLYKTSKNVNTKVNK